MISGSKSLIVNADDFGWSSGVNRGIVDACRNGILTSTTAMVNFPAFSDAAGMSRDTPELGVGLHINVVHGPPACKPSDIPTLVDSSGAFPGPNQALRRLLLGTVSTRELDLELNCQLRRFREEFGEPTHLDSHKHMHIFGALVPALTRLSRKLEVPRVRCPIERISMLPPSMTKLKSLILTCFGTRARRSFLEAGISTTEHFAGALESHSLTSSTCHSIVDGLQAGTTELMCHPGYLSDDDHDVIPGVAATQYREGQMQMLLDPSLKEHIIKQGVKLIHFGQLST